MTTLFVTGNDTGCGKTYVTCLLVNYLKQSGISCIALKPIASGCEWQVTELTNEDVEQLMLANQSSVGINKWLFRPPVSPHFVAFEQTIELSAEETLSFCHQPQFMTYQYRLIEGAGGLMVPLNDTQTWVDMVKVGQTAMIVVIAIRLGCINQSLLLNEVINKHDLPVVGWIANKIDDTTSLVEENIEAIKTRVDMPLLATVDYNATHIHPEPELLSMIRTF